MRRYEDIWGYMRDIWGCMRIYEKIWGDVLRDVSGYMSTGGRWSDYWTSRVRPKAGGQPASYPPNGIIVIIINKIIIKFINIITTIIIIIINSQPLSLASLQHPLERYIQPNWVSDARGWAGTGQRKLIPDLYITTHHQKSLDLCHQIHRWWLKSDDEFRWSCPTDDKSGAGNRSEGGKWPLKHPRTQKSRPQYIFEYQTKLYLRLHRNTGYLVLVYSSYIVVVAN